MSTSFEARYSYIRQLYDRIMNAVVEGADYRMVLENTLPLILVEVDSILSAYPQARDVFLYLFRSLWTSMFPRIPLPDTGEETRATDIPELVRRVLSEHRGFYQEKLGRRGKAVTTRDVEDAISRDVITFTDILVRSFVKHYGLW